MVIIKFLWGSLLYDWCLNVGGHQRQTCWMWPVIYLIGFSTLMQKLFKQCDNKMLISDELEFVWIRITLIQMNKSVARLDACEFINTDTETRELLRVSVSRTKSQLVKPLSPLHLISEIICCVSPWFRLFWLATSLTTSLLHSGLTCCCGNKTAGEKSKRRVVFLSDFIKDTADEESHQSRHMQREEQRDDDDWSIDWLISNTYSNVLSFKSNVRHEGPSTQRRSNSSSLMLIFLSLSQLINNLVSYEFS